ncbi:MAG: radical SAM protein [Magnetococcales bacterium]|nr:radical SAM protein [Magnetococcales bacterium]
MYESVYSSKIFSFTDNDPYLPKGALLGGTGYGSAETLPEEIEHSMPDYALYGINYSMGFATRGCIRNCTWCVVPSKEGEISAHAEIEEFLAHKDLVLLDNNILAHEHGLREIEKIAKLGLRIDINQGLDARLIDNNIAKLLSRVKWLKPLRLACDHSSQIRTLQKAVTLLRWHNVTPRRYSVYVLVDDVSDALERVMFLKGMDLDPFAQPYLDGTNKPSEMAAAFARWVNHKAIFKSVTWEEYSMEMPAAVSVGAV